MTDCEQGKHHFFAPDPPPTGIYTCNKCPAQVEILANGCWIVVEVDEGFCQLHNRPKDDCPERCWK